MILFVLTKTTIVGGESTPIALGFATVLTVSTFAAGFTSLAIATAFERRSDTLVFLGTTPMTRVEVVLAKSTGSFLLALFAGAFTLVAGLLLGWIPTTDALIAPIWIALGVFSVSGFGYLLAGTVRAEAVLAVANAVFLFVLVLGGVLFAFDSAATHLLEFFPPLALKRLIEVSLNAGATWDVNVMQAVLVLVGWGVVGHVLASRFFKWR